MIFPGVPVVITLVVRIVIGVLIPVLLVTPAMTKMIRYLFYNSSPVLESWKMIQLNKCWPVAPGCVIMADMGIVLIIVVPCLVVVGETPLIFRIVGLFPVPPAWDVVMIVVGLPSAEVTSFKMVPAGSGPFVWEEEILCKQLDKYSLCLGCSCTHADSWPEWSVWEG